MGTTQSVSLNETYELALTPSLFKYDDEAGEDEAGGGEAGVEGQSQRSSSSRGLSAEAAEAGAGDIGVVEALGASAESAAARVCGRGRATGRRGRETREGNGSQRRGRRNLSDLGPKGGEIFTVPHKGIWR